MKDKKPKFRESGLSSLSWLFTYFFIIVSFDGIFSRDYFRVLMCSFLGIMSLYINTVLYRREEAVWKENLKTWGAKTE